MPADPDERFFGPSVRRIVGNNDAIFYPLYSAKGKGIHININNILCE